jgi:hypothetical protein
MRKLFTIAILALSLNAFAQVPTTGLIGHWPFNGNASDISGNGNNGTINGATLTTDRFGNLNSAYFFPGNVANKIVIPDTILYNFTSGFTVSAWAYFQQNWSNHGESIIYKGGSPFNSGWHVGVDQNVGTYGAGNYNIYAELLGYTSSNYCCFPFTNINIWRHYVMTFDGNYMKIFIDGVLHDSIISSAAIVNNNFDIEVGGSVNPVSGAYDRSIDDIRIYNRPLNTSEVTALFNESICYQTITVTDTLIINANITGFSPVSYQNSIKIYPNPTNDQITIDFGSNYSTLNGYTMKITNSLSQIVYTTLINNQTSTVNLSTWTGNGIYFVHLIDAQSNTIDIKKIIIQ